MNITNIIPKSEENRRFAGTGGRAGRMPNRERWSGERFHPSTTAMSYPAPEGMPFRGTLFSGIPMLAARPGPWWVKWVKGTVTLTHSCDLLLSQGDSDFDSLLWHVCLMTRTLFPCHIMK